MESATMSSIAESHNRVNRLLQDGTSLGNEQPAMPKTNVSGNRVCKSELQQPFYLRKNLLARFCNQKPALTDRSFHYDAFRL
jgi:hypothetical protein